MNLDDPSAIGSLLDDLVRQLPRLDALRAGAELYGAPRLFPIEMIGLNENAISRLIADLFDPKGHHGQGSLFLDQLLVQFGFPIVRVGDPVRVRREVLTPKRRRIDLVIETPSILIGIENKPWAGQQPNQLSDYLHELDRLSGGRRRVLVFISDQEEKSAKGEIVRLPYFSLNGTPSLHGLLTSALPGVRAERARVHIREMIHFIESEFGDGSMQDQEYEAYTKAIVAELSSSVERRRALGAILLAQEEIQKRIIESIGEYLLTELRTKVAPDFQVLSEGTLFACLEEKYGMWQLRRQEWPPELGLCIQSQLGYFDNVIFGVRAPDPSAPKVKAEVTTGCAVRQKVEDLTLIIPDGRKSVWWPWWQHCSPRHWGPEFAGSILIDSPAAAVDQNPEVQRLASRMIQLAETIETSLR